MTAATTTTATITDYEARVFAAMTSVLTTAMQYGLRVQATYQAAHPTNKAIEVEIRRA